MISSIARLIVIAAALLLASLGLSIIAGYAKKQDISDTSSPLAQQDFDVPDPDTALPQAKLPVLRIDGKENADVYLQSLDIQVEVTGNIASTRYTMVFKNRTDRILEGELTFPLPDGRSVTHYALDINGSMREAVPVEKAKATQVFEEIQRREVDPGILERVEGNNFRTRVYPIPRNGTRTISIGYEEELALEKEALHYRLPMAYPEPLEKFAVKATVRKGGQKPVVPEDEDEIRFDMAGENYVASLARENYQPARALIFALPAPAGIPQVMMQPAQGSFYFLASVAPNLEARKKQWSDELAIIWDVSLSGSQRNLEREMKMLNIIFADKKNTDVHLYFLNNKLIKKVWVPKFAYMNKNGEYKVADGRWDRLRDALQRAIYDGGTDFSQINLKDIKGKEILFFSDGISTLSDADFLKDTKDNRPIHCFVSSAKADYSAMKLIAGKTKGKYVNISALSSARLRNELLNETPQFLGTEHGEDVREAYPNIATSVQGNFSIAGISDAKNTELTLLFGFGDKVEKRIKVKLEAKNAGSQGNIYKIWAQKKIAELDLEYEKNRAELTELGQQFGIVTRNTSLMVLELLNDYIRFSIAPPAAEPQLLAEYQRRLKGQPRDAEHTLLNEAAAAAENIKKWWTTDFTPQKPKYPTPDNNQSIGNNRSSELRSGCHGRPITRGTAGIGYGSGYGSGFGGSGGRIDDLLGGLLSGGGVPRASSPGSPARSVGEKDEGKSSQPIVTIKPVRKDNDYLNGLTGKVADDYQTYLILRDDYANSPAFYFDMSEWFHKHGDRETALRVLTSIAELELEDASLYRLLGYRLKEYGEHALQKFVCQKVIQWRPIEPQSYRDYALALADNGEPQAALDSLYSMLTRPYSASIAGRSRGIEEAAVTEINHLIAKNPRLNTSKIDRRLIINTPVDVRVVMNWNMDNVDIDLYVKDPNGEYCYHGCRESTIGGRLGADITGGYGPEQFMLKKAVRGKYQIYVNYYSAREFAAAGPATVMAEIYTGYADKTERRTVVTLQMSKAKGRDGERVEVAEFELGDPYQRSATGVIYDTATPSPHKNRWGRVLFQPTLRRDEPRSEGSFPAFQGLSRHRESRPEGAFMAFQDHNMRRGSRPPLLLPLRSDFVRSGWPTGGRSSESIQRVVMQNTAAVRYAFNKRLRDNPGLGGKITVRFAINESGKVISAGVTESTTNDATFDSIVVNMVMSWQFDKIDIPGDVTEIAYPFVFSQ